MTPYYDDGTCVIYHGDALAGLAVWELTRTWTECDVLVTDPPYGISYKTGAPRREGSPRSIVGDESVQSRTFALSLWKRGAPEVADYTGEPMLGYPRPALVFGSPRVPPPVETRATLIWNPGGALGMGDLSLPWKCDHQEIYVIDGPWAGSRDCGSVISCPPVQSIGREHPHEKPVSLLVRLLEKCIPGSVADPFMGTGTTLVAAKSLGRKAIGFEIEERYCEIAAKRLAQEVLDFGGVA